MIARINLKLFTKYFLTFCLLDKIIVEVINYYWMNLFSKKTLYDFLMKLPLGKRLLLTRYKIKQRKIEKENLSFNKMLECYKNLPIKKADVYDSMLLNEKKFYRALIIDNNEKYQNYSIIPISDATVLEIGSGRCLAASIGLSLCGFKKVITVDACRSAVPKSIEKVYRYCMSNKKYLGIKKRPKLEKIITDENLNELLLEKFDVEYCAPCNYGNINLPNDSVDYIISNSVFKYEGNTDLLNIAKESFRVLRDGGICFVIISFIDHDHLKGSVTIYDYLQYSTKEWQEKIRLKNIIEIQNRLRTVDYLDIFTKAGFEILEVSKYAVNDKDRAAFATIKVADEFKQKYTDEELMEKGVNIVLRKSVKMVIDN